MTTEIDQAEVAAQALAQLDAAHVKIDNALANETVTPHQVGEELRDRAVRQALHILAGKIATLEATTNMLDTNVCDMNKRVRRVEGVTIVACQGNKCLFYLGNAIANLKQYAERIGTDQARAGQVAQCLSIMYQHYGIVATEEVEPDDD